MTQDRSAPAPTRGRLIPALLGLLAPGLGHAFVGRPLRGAAWAAVPFVGMPVFLAVTSEPAMSSLLTALVALILVAWFGAVVDVAATSPKTHRRTSVPGLVALAAAAYVGGPVGAMALRGLVVEAFKVPAGSMIPTVLVGDHLFADKGVYRARAPRRGEVLVFRLPEQPKQQFLKRAIAVEGDTLEVKGGHPVLNGWTVPSCRVGTHRYTEAYDGRAHEGELFVEFLEASAYLVFLEAGGLDLGDSGPFLAGPGETWVLGDNRHNSHDSRMWFGGVGGGVPAENVVGRARTVWMSVEPERRGVDLAGDPIAPAPELAGPLADCLAKRPTVAEASPPAPP